MLRYPFTCYSANVIQHLCESGGVSALETQLLPKQLQIHTLMVLPGGQVQQQVEQQVKKMHNLRNVLNVNGGTEHWCRLPTAQPHARLC